MALITPVLLAVNAFDATEAYTFKFAVGVGGNQVVKNKLTIKNNTNNATVYEQEQASFKYEHVVPASTLTNGVNYNASVVTYDSQGNVSAASNSILFWCYSTPTIEFTNIPATSIITSASFNFEFKYTQAEGEKINSYIVNLYNSFKSQISTSGTQYAVDGSSPFVGQYLFTGFEENNIYFIEVVAQTVEETTIRTGQIQFIVSYSKPEIYTLVELANNCNAGFVSVKSNISLIEGEITGPEVYIDNKEINLSDYNSVVIWDEGYKINGDFLLRAWFRHPNLNSNIIQFSNTKGQLIDLYYNERYIDDDDTKQKKALVRVIVDGIEGYYGYATKTRYTIYSDYVDILETSDTSKYYFLWMERKDNIYGIKLTIVG